MGTFNGEYWKPIQMVCEADLKAARARSPKWEHLFFCSADQDHVTKEWRARFSVAGIKDFFFVRFKSQEFAACNGQEEIIVLIRDRIAEFAESVAHLLPLLPHEYEEFWERIGF